MSGKPNIIGLVEKATGEGAGASDVGVGSGGAPSGVGRGNRAAGRGADAQRANTRLAANRRAVPKNKSTRPAPRPPRRP